MMRWRFDLFIQGRTWSMWVQKVSPYRSDVFWSHVVVMVVMSKAVALDQVREMQPQIFRLRFAALKMTG